MKTIKSNLNMLQYNLNTLRGRLTGRRPVNTTSRNVLIAGAIVAGAALVGYSAMVLYKRWKANRDNSQAQLEDGQDNSKSFAPSYRGKHKPHHRKAETNGHMHN